MRTILSYQAFFFLVTPPLPHNSTDYGAQVTALPARDIWQGRFLQVLKLACARYYLAQSGFEPGLSRWEARALPTAPCPVQLCDPLPCILLRPTWFKVEVSIKWIKSLLYLYILADVQSTPILEGRNVWRNPWVEIQVRIESYRLCQRRWSCCFWHLLVFNIEDSQALLHLILLTSTLHSYRA